MWASTALLVVHGLAAFAALSLPGFAVPLALAGIIMSAGTCIAPLVSRKNFFGGTLTLNEDGSILGHDVNDQPIPLELASHRILAPGFVVMALRPVHTRRATPIPLFAWDQDEEPLRQLRLWLQWRSNPRGHE
ncbi:MAG: hypothetical protein ACKVQU_24930 [Burkholderiales bacterium]